MPPAPFPRRPLIEELEPRLLFSADFAPALADALAPQVEQRVIGTDGNFTNTPDSLQQAQHAQFEVVFLDLRVEGYDKILADIHAQNTSGRSIEVVLLDAERDGIAQIGDFLSQHHNIDAVHIISHGSAGAVNLGSGQLNFDSLVKNAAAIKQWGNALSSEADILIYGCDVAATADGQSLINALSKLTGADVAASEDRTGSAQLGGDWNLEYQNGVLETTALFSQTAPANWMGLLAPPSLTWMTFMGGAGQDTISGVGNSVAVDGSGNIYVIGTSTSTWGSPVRAFNGMMADDTFVAKFSSSGSLIWNTFLGGTGTDTGCGIAVDSSGNVYVDGYSTATWGAPVRAFGGGNDAFAAKLSSNGTLVWNTFLGGAGNDFGFGVSVDGSGNVYVGGYSGATWGAPVRTYGGGTDGFVAKLNNSGTLTWNSFAGGAGTDYGWGVTVDTSGNAYLSGQSSATWGTVPVRAYSSGDDAYAARFDSSGNLTWNTFLGGSGTDTGRGIAVDGSGNVYVGGDSSATWGSPVQAFGGTQDTAVSKLNSSGALQWNTFLGGTGTDNFAGIAVDGSGTVYVGGDTNATWGAAPWRAYTSWDVFTASLNTSGSLLSNGFLGGGGTDGRGSIATDGIGNVYVAGYSTATWGSPLNAVSTANDVFVTKIATNAAPANTAPVNTAPAGQYTAYNTPIVFSSGNGNLISISDVDAGIYPVQVTLTVGHGTLTLAGTAGLTFSSGANGTATMTFTGTTTAINTALDGLSFTPTTNYRGLDTLQIVTNDQGNTGTGGALSDTDSVKLYIGALVVTNTTDLANGTTTSITSLVASDGGDGISLREAILATDNTAGADTVFFNIAGAGVQTIAVSSYLPSITGAVVIDGTSQPGYAGTPLIELNGAATTYDGIQAGLVISGGGTTVKGLIINRFAVDGIRLQGGSGNLIQGNYIGTDATGMIDLGNGYDGIFIVSGSTNNTIGGPNAADRNVISGNDDEGIEINGGSSNLIQGNIIGMAADGVSALRNTSDGVLVTSGTLNQILQNRIATNGGLGINLAGGTQDAYLVTANDAGDADAGANNLQNYPVLTSAFINGPQITLTGSLNSTASGYYRIEFFASSAADAAGYGEGQRYLGFVNVATDVSGNATFNPTLTATVAAGEIVSATTTNSNAGYTTFTDTSEFAQNVIASTNSAPVLDASKSPTLAAQNEDSGAPVGAVGTLVSALVDFASPAGQVDNVTDANAGALLGIAVTAADTTNGSWWYSTNGGTTWNALSAVSDASAQLLASDASTRIYFQANANYNSSIAAAITFRAWDQTSGSNGALANTSSNGGTTAFSAATDTASIVINAVNDRPVAVNQGLLFDGIDDKVVVTASASLQMTSALTIEAWIRPQGTPTLNQMILNKEGEYELCLAPSGRLQVAITNTSPGWSWIDTGYTPTIGQWTHIAVTYDGSTINTYANGVLVHSVAGSGAVGDAWPAMNDLTLGARQNGADSTFQGMMDEVRIWNVARSAAQIAANYDQTLTGTEAGLVGYWQFAEGSGSTVLDSTANGNTGVLGGGTVAAEPSRLFTYSVAEDTPLSIAGPGVLANASDAEGSALTAVLVSGPIHAASFSLNNDGSFSYTPVANYYGSDSFVFQASDGVLSSTSATVMLTVTAVNDAPLVNSATLTLNEGQTVTLSTANFGITDPDNSSFTYTVSAVAGGFFQLSSAAGTPITTFTSANLAANLVQFVDDDNEAAPSFSVTVNDGTVNSNTLAATISYTPVNDAPTFGAGDGAITTDFGSGDIAYAVTVQADGKILLAGSATVSGNDDFALARYNLDGSLDTSFGSGGKVTTALSSGTDWAHGVAVQADGKIVVVGRGYNGSDWDVAVVRYNADGSLDTSFGGGAGKVTVDVGSGDDVANMVALQADGKIVVSAHARIGSTDDIAVLRFNTDGTLDTSFGGTGKVTSAIGPGNESGQRLTIQSDGKIVISGYSSNGTDNDFAVLRYNADGSLDTGFGGSGIVTTAIGPGNDSGSGVAVQADGKIVVAGASSNGSNDDFAIVRYNADGTLDTSFGGTGKITTPIGPSSDQGQGLRLQADGKIVVGGMATLGGTSDFAVVRYNTDGSLDSSFGSGGKTTVAIGLGNDISLEMALQADGQILLAGRSHNGSNDDFALVRIGTSGTPDSSFDQLILNGRPTYVENGAAVVLDSDVQLFDAELAAAGNYAGGSLTLGRNGGAHVQDVFSATGNLSTLAQGGNLVLSGVTIGIVTTNSSGTLLLAFNSNATQARINEALQSIAYANGSDAPPASVQINWAFNDGNTGAQGSGGTLSATGSTTVNVIAVNDAPAGVDKTVTTQEDTAYTFMTADFGFSDVDGNSLDRVWFATLPAQGMLKWNGAVFSAGDYVVAGDIAAGQLTYTPAANGTGTGYASFTFQVQDNGGTANGGIDLDPTPKTMTINVTAVNDAPVITSDGGGDAASTSIAENTTAVTTVTATDIDLPAQTLTYAIYGGADAAKFSINSSTGALSFISPPDYENPQGAGANPYVYEVTLGVTDGSLTDTQTMGVIVWNANEAPVVTTTATALTYTENDAAMAVDPGVTVSDVDSLALAGATVTISSNYAVGQDVLAFTDQLGISGSWNATTGVLTLTGSTSPANYQTALRSVTYVNTSDSPSTLARTVSFVARDSTLSSVASTRNINVTPVNDAPVAVDDVASGNEDSAIAGNVLTNDTDIDSVGLTATLVSGPANGLLVLNADGSFTYTPNANFNGSDSFTYTANDGALDSNIATVTLTVNPVNDAPTTTPVTLAPIAEDSGARLITQAELLANATDVDGPGLTATTLAIAAGSGTLVDNLDGTWTYTPASNDDTSVSFSYRVTDGSLTAAGSAALDITPVNDAPVGNDDGSVGTPIAIAEDTAVAIDVAANDSDVDGTLDTTTVTIVTGPTNGSVSVNAVTGVVTYTPNANYNGTDVFTYQVRDNTGALSNAASAHLSVTPVNDAPTLDSTPFVSFTPITENDVNNPGDLVSDLINGAITDSDMGSVAGIAIHATSETNGYFQYSTDGGGSWINVGAVNNSSALLLRDSDRVRFVPNGANSGSGGILYWAWDQTSGVVGTKVDGNSRGGTTAFSPDAELATVSASGVNDAPVITSNGGGDTASTTLVENTSYVTTVTASDIDVPAQTLSYSITGGGDAGKFSIDSNSGVLGFIVPPNYENPQGSLSGGLVYEVTVGVSDGSLTDIQTLNVGVSNVNEAPVAVDDPITINEDGGGFVPMPGVLGNDSDVDSASLSAILVTGPSNGSFTLNSNGSFWYWPAPNFYGVDSFTYKVSDGALDSNIATVTITVNPVNDAPAAVADSASGNEDSAIAGNALTNDTDIDSVGLTATLVSGPANGLLVLNADGSFTYTPNANFNGSDSFTYTANDGALDSNIATVTLTVNPVNGAPVISANSLSITEGTTVILDSTNLNAADIEQGPAQLTYTVSNIANGQFEWAATPGVAITGFTQADINAGQVVFVHDASNFAPTYDVTVSDGTLTQGPQAATISFTAVNEGINVSPASGPSTTEAGGSVTFDVTLNSQPFDDVTIFIVSSNAAEGTASVSSLTFTASDWNVARQVTVTGVNDFVDDGDQAYSIQLQAAISADRNYNALDAADVALSNLDDDTAGITLTPTAGLTTDEAGASDTFSVVLTAQPLADVIIGLSSSNSAEGVLSTNSLVFTPGNWNNPQIVTVTGVDDTLNDGSIAYQAMAAPASSTDPLYNGIGAGTVDITNLDVVDSVLVDPVPDPPTPEPAPVTPPVDEAPPAPASVIKSESSAQPIGDSGFVADSAQSNPVETVLNTALKTRGLLFFNDEPLQHQQLTNPETQGALLLRLLEIIQVEHQGGDSGSNTIAPAIQVEISQDEAFQVDIFRQGAQITAVSLSVGAVWWALRVGGLFASLLTSLPAWRSFDLLPVLSRDEDEDEPSWEFDADPDKKDQNVAKRPQEETA